MATSDWDAAQLLSYFDRLSNWGRWGGDDELGTLNYISPAVRADAVARAWSALDAPDQMREDG